MDLLASAAPPQVLLCTDLHGENILAADPAGLAEPDGGPLRTWLRYARS
jgi:hypothetical protein